MSELEGDLSGLSQDQRRLVELWLRSRAAPAATPAPCGIPRRAAGARCPLAFAQQPLWFLHQWDPASSAHTFPIAVRLRGPCAAATLARCLQLIVARHEALRATFRVADGLIEQVFAPTAPLPVPQVDLDRIPPARQERLVQRLVRAVIAPPFDLERGPLLRACILRRAAHDHVLILAIHHIAFDDWSQGVLLRELAALYAALAAGKPAALPELPLQYGDYALWQRRRAPSSALDDQLAFWTTQLRDAPAHLDLPTDYPRPTTQSAQGAHHSFVLPASLAEDLAALSRRSGATLFMILLAALNVLLARSSGQTDIVVGAPISTRTDEDLEGLIGLFMNLLALRTDLRGNPTAAQLLARVRQATLAAYAHQQVMFDQILETLQIARDPSRHPLFQVLLVLQNAPMPALKQAGLAIEPIEIERDAARWDLALFMREDAGGLRGRLEYRTDLFTAATIQRMAGHLQTLLAGIAADPQRPIARLPLLSPVERRQILAEWNATAAASPTDRSLGELVADQAARTPDAVAAVCGSACLSYAALIGRADHLARYLRAHGVGPGARVGLCLPRSLDLVVALLGVVTIGSAYVPLDPAYPPARLAGMLADARLAALLTTVAQDVLVAHVALAHPGALPPTCIRLDADWPRIAACSSLLPPRRAGADGLLYLIYTSGSTGQPKGAAVFQRGFRNLLHWFVTAFALGADDGALVIASFSFDLTQKDLFAPLISGGRLHLLDAAYDPALITRRIAARRISWINCTPSAFYPVAEAEDAPAALASLRYVFLGGEPIALARLRAWAASDRCQAHIVNTYGPTECTDVVASDRLAPPGSGLAEPPLGRPIANTQLLILDRQQELAPVGVAGELCVGGAGVGLGYLNDPALTAARFIPNPFAQESGVRSQESEAERCPVDAQANEESQPSSFVLRPSSSGSRLYKTGDLARWRADGRITYLGRMDAQIKLRGYRIELEEVASALRAHAAVREAVAIVRADAPGDPRLVAYVVTSNDVRVTSNAGSSRADNPTNDEGGAIDDGLHSAGADLSRITRHLSLAAELRAHLAARLPEYMLPSAFVALDALPLTPNGKIDRRALPAPDAAAHDAAAPFRAPRDAAEELLAGVWGAVLGGARVGIDDNFFTLGGHSLLATQVVARVRQVFGVDLPLRALFEHPTVAGLAERIAQERRADSPLRIPPLTASSRPERLPLSFAQQRLWFLHEFDPSSSAYHLLYALRLDGALDLAALARTFGAIVARHEVLRTSFVLRDGAPTQRIAPASRARWTLLDLSALPEGPRERSAEALARVAAQMPFDLARGPLIRAALLRMGADEHRLLISLHHIVADGWSIGILVREVGAGYAALRAGLPIALPALPVQYADYALWQRAWLRGELLESQLAYWRAQLADLPALDLPTDRPATAARGEAGPSVRFRLSGELAQALAALSRRAGATQFMTMLAAFQALLSRYSGQDDIAVGTPIANRADAATEGLIGFFVNTLVLRADLRGNPRFADLLAQARRRALDAYAHQDLPFEQLVEALQPARSLTQTPLFRVMFALQNAPFAPLELPGLRAARWALDAPFAQFDLSLTISELPDGVHGQISYRADLFDPTTIARLAGHYQNLLASSAADPSQPIGALALLSAAERTQLVVEWNATTSDYLQDVFLHELIAAQAARTPHAIALACGEQHLSYAALLTRAHHLAHDLRARGVEPEIPVAVCLERSLELPIALLSVLLAGGVYVPLDPHAPRERLTLLLAQLGAQVVLTKRVLARALPPGAPSLLCLDALAMPLKMTNSPRCTLAPENLAYIIFTSGSTGAPKGVQIAHAALARHCLAARDHYALNADDRVLQFAVAYFDAALEQLLPPLLCGATVLLRGEELWESARCAKVIAAQRLSVINPPTAYWQQLVSEWETDGTAPRERGLRLVIVGGEAMSHEAMRAWERLFGQQARLLNAYGPTEATITATSYAALEEADVGSGRGAVSIGRALGEHSVYVLDGPGNLAPPGVVGELYLGGATLARGYLGRPDLTAERFVPNPFASIDAVAVETQDIASLRPHARLYKTGDLARYRADGNIEFLGRVDQQVKLRGYRIEPGEIEAALQAHPSVRQAAVLLREDAPGDERLVAYVVTSDESGVTSGSGSTKDERRTTNDGAEPSSFVLRSSSRAAEEADASLVTRRSSLAAELRVFLAARLPRYMVPTAFVLLERMPLTSSGKLDRRALPPAPPPDDARYVAPRDATEALLAAVWAEVLRRERIGIHDDFFDLGGHSLLAVRLLERVRQATGRQLPLASLFQDATIAAQAALVHAAPDPSGWRPLVPIQPHGSARPIFIVHGIGGTILDFRALGAALGPDQPLYGLQARGVEDDGAPFDSIEVLAAAYLAAIRTVQPAGPYRLAGWSFGGLVALELARRLADEGETVEQLALLDSRTPQALVRSADPRSPVLAFAAELGRQLGAPPGFRPELPAGEVAEQLRSLLAQGRAAGLIDQDMTLDQVRRRFAVFAAHQRAAARYQPLAYAGPIAVLYARDARDGHARGDPSLGWEAALGRAVTAIETPGDHYTMLQPPHVGALAEHLRRAAPVVLARRAVPLA